MGTRVQGAPGSCSAASFHLTVCVGVPGTRNVSPGFESRKLVFKNLGFKAILFGSGDAWEVWPIGNTEHAFYFFEFIQNFQSISGTKKPVLGVLELII